MSETLVSPVSSLYTEQTQRSLKFPWWRIALAGILLISAFLELFQLNQEGYANTYYAAAVQSMLTSWHNFFFVSYDSAGFVTLDKPPLGFWIQAASAKLLGFSGFSLLLPEALAAIASVALLYLLVARAFGRPAGLCAALVLALTPISMVVARNNTIDSQLILVLLLAVYCVSRAAESGRISWLLWCALCIGLGFNIKMLQAYLIVPACALAYLLGAPIRWRTRFWHLALAGLLLLVISLCWAVAVDLTPATLRPFVSDSGTNSELSLILGYNGLGRVLQLFAPNLQTIHIFGIAIDLTLAPGSAPNIGDPGPLRLFNQGIGNQISWLLPFALLGLLGAAWQVRWRAALGRTGVALLLWGGWLLTVVVYFSFARFFHLYYLVMIAPPLAALVGIGLVALWREYHRAGLFWWGLSLALVVTALGQAAILQSFTTWSSWLTPLVIAGSVLVAAIFIALHLWPRLRMETIRIFALLGLFLLLLAPLVWDGISLQNNDGAAWLPQAGPSQGMGFGGGGGPRGNAGARGGQQRGAGGFPGRQQGGGGASGRPQGAGGFPGRQQGGAGGFPGGMQGAGGQPASDGFQGQRGGGGFGAGGSMVIAGAHWNVLDPKLVQYLQAQQGHATYLAATESATYASVLILATGKPVMTLGGYQGWDRILTPTELSHLVSTGMIRFFYISANQANGPSQQSGASGQVSNGGDANIDLEQWVHTSCSVVAPSLWQTTTTQGNGSQGAGLQLYDCAKKPS